MKSSVRVIIPDSHGASINVAARDAVLRDIKRLDPDVVVWLGDHLDCGGVFSAHAKTYTNELTESYADDCDAANEFLDLVQKAAPRAAHHYAEGNHERRVEAWATRNLGSKRDADAFVEKMGPEAALDLKRRGFKYYRQGVSYQGLPIPGTFRLGKIFYTHGIGCSVNAAQVHVNRFGASVVFGHIHRSVSVISRSVTSSSFGAWSPGTLAELQPYYMHTTPTSWSHGYGVEFISPGGAFIHVNVPIAKGKSMLMDVARRVA